MLSSSFVYGDPIGTISSIVTLGYAYSKTKNKDSLRKLKWASIRGAAGVAAFALSTKLISITILNILIGICAAAVVKKTIGIMRLWEYRFFLRNIKKYIPVLKKEMSRREFISLKIFTYKNA